MTQTINIFPTPPVKPEKHEKTPVKFGDIIQKETHLTFISGSHDFEQNVMCFNKNPRQSNSFISCVLECYNKHIPLKITPDVIYIAILVQFCTYINTRAKKSAFQKFFKGDVNKMFEFNYSSGNDQDIKTFDFENMFDDFSNHVKSTLKNPELIDIFDCNFSTSTKKDKIVSRLLLAATLKDYYSYYGYPSCGIPHIEILGTQEDWKLMLENCKHLEQYDYDDELSKWLNLLYPILHQFIDVYQDKDPSSNEFWSKMVRRITGGSGYNHIDGWLTAFTFFRLGCVENYDFKLGEYKSFSLIHNDQKIIYPFVHYNSISNGNVSFDVNLCGWSSKKVKAEVNVGQFFYSYENGQLKTENDWFVVADIFENATLRFSPNNKWCKNLLCALNPNKKETYFRGSDQVLHLLEPVYQDGHWEKSKFIDGHIDDFLHFFVSSIDECYTDEFKTCFKCYQKGSFEVEIFQGVRYVDKFMINRKPLDSVIDDCVGAPYIIPMLRQWLENNYEFSGFPMFKNADNGRISLGHIIYRTMDRQIDGTLMMLRLEIPLSKMKKTQPDNVYNHSLIDQFNKLDCVCNQVTKPLYQANAILDFEISKINKCDHYPIMTKEEFKGNKCWYCLSPYAFQMEILLNQLPLDKFVIISEKPLETLYPFQKYQFIYQWLLNNVNFDSTTITKFNLMPVGMSSSYENPQTFRFHLDSTVRIKTLNPNRRHNLPIWNITEQSGKDFTKALCYCDDKNLMNLECRINDHPITANKSSLMWKITTKPFVYEGYHIQRPNVKAGSLMIDKDESPERSLSMTFNFDPNCLQLTNVDQQFKNFQFEIPLKVCKDSFDFRIQ